MASWPLNTQQIDRLLNQPKMTAQIASNLFKNVEFSGTIKQWRWLTNSHVKVLLDRARDYDSLKQLLTHKHFDEDMQAQWLGRLRLEHQELKRNAERTKSPIDCLNVHLDHLRIKAYEHSVEALTDTNYSTVAFSAFELYVYLRKETQDITKKTPAQRAQIIRNCQTVVADAQPVLATHRGYKQSFIDILNVLAICLTLRFTRFKSDDWRFFKTNTASMQIANQVLEALPNTEILVN
jgi:hypothetical protein